MAKNMRIAAMSVAAPELEQIKAIMASLRGDAGAHWEWSGDTAGADVLIIDADSLYGHMDWLRAQSSGRNVICLTASNGHEQDNVLHRPVGVGGIKASLLRAAGAGPEAVDVAEPVAPVTEEAPATTPAAAVAAVFKRITGQQRTVTDTAPAPTPAPAAVASAAAKPAPAANPMAAPNLLPRRVTGQQPAVAAAPASAPAPAPTPAPPAVPREWTLADYFLPENLAEARRLERSGQPPLIVDAGADRYYGGLTLKPLLPYCLGQIKPVEWQAVPTAEIEKLRAMNAGLPLSRLLWLYVIGTSNGTTLLPGFDLNGKFKLVKWPQIEREFPKHFRIGTAMMKGPSTLQEIADGSGATVGEVIDFVNAYAAIGFAIQDGGTPISDRRALLERLRARTA